MNKINTPATAIIAPTNARIETCSLPIYITEGMISIGTIAVIVDATFLQRSGRDSFRRLAARLGLPFVIIDCRASPEQLRQRLIDRERQQHDASEADVKVMERQLVNVEPLADTELNCSIKAESADQGSALWRRLQRCSSSQQ